MERVVKLGSQWSDPYTAESGRTYPNALEFVEHYLWMNPGIVERIDEMVNGYPYVNNWCGPTVTMPKEYEGHACACMGCINGHFFEIDLEEANPMRPLVWEIWNMRYRTAQPCSPCPGYEQWDEVSIWVNNPPEDKAVWLAAFKLLRAFTQDGMYFVKQTMLHKKQWARGEFRYIKPLADSLHKLGIELYISTVEEK